MRLFKMYAIDWQLGSTYIIERQGRFTGEPPRKMIVTGVFNKCIELKVDGSSKPFILKKSDFNILGDWEMIEQV